MTTNLVIGMTMLAKKTTRGDVPGAVVQELEHAAEDGVVGLAAEGAGLEHRQEVGRDVAHEADEEEGEDALQARRDAAVQRRAAARAGRRAEGRDPAAGAAAGKAGVAGGQDGRARSRVCHISHSSRLVAS